MHASAKVKRRRWLVSLAIFLIILIAAGLGLAQVWRNRNALQTAQLSTAQVSLGSISRTVYGSGSIAAVQNISVFAPVDALVEEIAVDQGDLIKKGDMIAVLKSDSLTAEIENLETSLASLDQQISQTRQTAGSATITSPAAGRLMLIYAAAGEPVDAVMDRCDALAVISADGHLIVAWQGEISLQPGSPVVVRSGGQNEEGILIRSLDGQNVVELPDSTLKPGVEAQIEDSSAHMIGQGILQISKPVYVTGNSGIIKSVSRSIGTKVSKGSKLFTLDSAGLSGAYAQLIDERADTLKDLQSARAQQALLTIVAPADGIVDQLKLSDKGKVLENQLICTLADVSGFKLLLQIDELDIGSIQVGQTAGLKLAANNYQTFAATVSRIAMIGTTSGGVTTYPVTLSIEPAAGILAGMSASADILVADLKNVLIIPMEAMKVDDSRTYFTLVRRDAEGRISFVDQDITVGLTNGTTAEVLSGLKAGDEVLTTDAAKESLTQGPFGMGGLRQSTGNGGLK